MLSGIFVGCFSADEVLYGFDGFVEAAGDAVAQFLPLFEGEAAGQVDVGGDVAEEHFSDVGGEIFEVVGEVVLCFFVVPFSVGAAAELGGVAGYAGSESGGEPFGAIVDDSADAGYHAGQAPGDIFDHLGAQVDEIDGCYDAGGVIENPQGFFQGWSAVVNCFDILDHLQIAIEHDQ